MTARPLLAGSFFFLIFVGCIYLCGRLLSPFFGSLLCAGILAVVFYPMHRWIAKRLPKARPWVPALLSDFAVFFFFVIPIGLLIWGVVAQADMVIPIVKEAAQKVSQLVRKSPTESFPVLRRLPPYLKDRLDTRSAEVRDRLAGAAESAVGYAATAGTAIAKNTINIALDVVILLFALFFFFRDGVGWYRYAHDLLPLGQSHKQRLDRRIHGTIIGVVRGTFITSLAQAGVATVAYFIIGVPGALVLGFMTFMATIIPSIGTALVWVPVAVYYIFAGPLWKGVVMVVFGILVGFVDNVVRPLVVGGESNMPFFWLFFAILGGIQIFGMMGLLLGPIIMAIMPILFDIYRTRYLNVPAESKGT